MKQQDKKRRRRQRGEEIIREAKRQSREGQKEKLINLRGRAERKDGEQHVFKMRSIMRTTEGLRCIKENTIFKSCQNRMKEILSFRSPLRPTVEEVIEVSGVSVVFF